MTDHDATHDHDPDDVDAAHRLDRYLDRLARGGVRPEGGLDPRLAAAARALRTQREDAAPDPVFVARLRETLTMDPTLTLPNSAATGATAPVPPALATDRRYPSTTSRIGTGGRDRTRPVTSAPATASPVRPLRPVRRDGWRRRGWPVVEILGVAALILGLVSVLLGGNGGNNGLPAFLPDLGQNTQQATPAVDPDAVAMAQGNAGRTGEMPGPGVASAPEVVWSKVLGSESFAAAPIVAGDTLYGTIQGQYPIESQVAAYDMATGNLRWQAGVDEGRLEYGVPAVSHGLVLVPVTDFGLSETDVVLATPGTGPTGWRPTGRLLALDAATGQRVWEFETGGIGYLSPLVVDDLVYVSDGIGLIQAVSIGTGEEVWSVTYPVDGTLTPNASLSSANGLIYAASNLGAIYALDALTGEQSWSLELGGNYPTTPVVADGTVYVASSQIYDPVGSVETPPIPDELIPATEPNAATPPAGSADPIELGESRLYAIDAATGDETWAVAFDHELRPAPTVTGDLVIVSGAGAGSDEVIALDAETGQTQQWSFTASGRIDTTMIVTGGLGYLGDFGSTFSAIDLSDGSIAWQVQTAGFIGLPATVADGRVFMATSVISGSTLYALGEAGGDATAVASGGPVDISGLPACSVQPRPEAAATPVFDGDGTIPTVTIIALEETPEYTLDGVEGDDLATIAWSEIPVGTPITDGQATGIADTYRQIQACSRSGDDRYLAAFYTDDFFLRPWVIEYGTYNGYGAWGIEDPPVDPATVSEQSRILPDGRLAVLRTFSGNPDYGQLVIFIEQDGRWLIDEYAEVTPDGVPGRG